MSATLLMVRGVNRGVRYAIDGDRLAIGRSSQAGIQLHGNLVSRQHAVICAAGRHHTIEDQSENGTFVNGVQTAGALALKPGDVIEIGESVLLYESDLEYLVGGAGADVIFGGEADETAVAELQTVRTRPAGAVDPSSRLLEIVHRALSGRPADALGAALSALAQQFGAERAFILEVDPRRETPRVVASFGEGPIVVSRTIVRHVLQDATGVVSGNAIDELALQGGVSLQAGEIRSVIAAPLLYAGSPIGMVHLDRRARGAYGSADLEAFVPLADILALVVLASRGLKETARDAVRANRIQAPDVIAGSPAATALMSQAERAAGSDATVLITGETGSGKEVIARFVHAKSPRRDQPFVAVNCGALPESLQESELFGHEVGAFTGAKQQKKGLFEVADGGTLFLDELGEMAASTQVKLLRALQERVIHRLGGTHPIPVDVRIVAATSRDLEAMVALGSMRQDLYFRLRVVHLRVPPLRQRLEDLGPLAARFHHELSRDAGIPPKTLSAEFQAGLKRHSWPGNVRELRNVVERATILSSGDTIGLSDLPADLLAGENVGREAIRSGETLAAAVARVEREMILRALDRTGANKSAVADALGISRVTLDAKLKAHRIPWPKRGRKK